VYGFSKSDKSNISKKELKAFKVGAKKQLSITDEQIRDLLQDGTFIEIIKGE